MSQATTRQSWRHRPVAQLGGWNAVTFDVEEWFHAANLAVPRQRWETLGSRLDEPIEKILSLLEEHQTRATFFVLGWLARRLPQLVRKIHDAGHEIASHGYWHESVTGQSRNEFADDVRLAKETIEEIIGHAVIGYRAPNYSINARTTWALAELEQQGFAYDSSVYPVRAPHGRYGSAGGPLRPYRIRPGLWEFPLPTMTILGRRIPAATGGYLRLCPMSITERALKQNARCNIPVVVNIHPWELDPDHPRWPAPWWKRALHYNNLHTTSHKLARLLKLHRFTAVSALLTMCEQHDSGAERILASCTSERGQAELPDRKPDVRQTSPDVEVFAS